MVKKVEVYSLLKDLIEASKVNSVVYNWVDEINKLWFLVVFYTILGIEIKLIIHSDTLTLKVRMIIALLIIQMSGWQC